MPTLPRKHLNIILIRIGALLTGALLMAACSLPAPIPPAPTAQPPVIYVTETPHPTPATLDGPVIVPPGENRLENPGFEGDLHDAGDGRMVFQGWSPTFCAPPLYGDCYASHTSDDQNPDNLLMAPPSYTLTADPLRVHSGSSAQRWFCEYTVCRGGVYQTFDTTPGEVCEVGAWVQSWSAPSDGGASLVRTDDDRANVTWYVRVDREGGSDPFAGRVRASRGFGFADGVYDQYVRIYYVFTASGPRTTVFFENTRLWPFARNESFLDDAYAVCGMPEDAPPTPAPPAVQVGAFAPLVEGMAWPGGEIGDMVRVGGEWWAYYASAEGDRSVIQRAISTDGINWHEPGDPALDASPYGAWDAVGMFGVTVVADEAAGMFHLWYLGRGDPDNLYTVAIGYATSTDGVHFTRASYEPVIRHGTPGAWDEERIDSAEAVQTEDGFVMYYSGTTLQPALIRQIGCAASTDGRHWSPCASNPVLWPQAAITPWEGIELEGPSVVIQDGVWLMAYTGFLGPQGNHWRIGLAASTDGETWSRLVTDPLIAMPPGQQESTLDPTLLYDKANGRLLLYYMDTRTGGVSIAAAPVTFGP